MANTVINLLIGHYYFFMKALFFGILIAVLFSLRIFTAALKTVDRKTWLLLFLILLSAIALRLYCVPHTHHVYFDEFEHLNVAQNLLYQGKFFITLRGSPVSCDYSTFSLWPPGYSYLLSVFLGVFGDSEAVAYNFSAIMGALSVAAIFVLLFLIFQDKNIGLLGAFLLNVLPVHLKYSGASEAGITSLFFILLALISALLYVRQKDLRSLFLLIFVSLFAVYTRPENGILILFLPLFVILQIPNSGLQGRIPRSHIFLALGIYGILIIPYLAQVLSGVYFLKQVGWNEGLLQRLAHFRDNALDNLIFWVSRFHPLSYTVAAVLGFWFLRRVNRKSTVFFILWFIFFYLLYTGYHVGNFLKNPDSDRYTLPMYLAVIPCAAFGIRQIIRILRLGKFTVVCLLAFVSVEIFSPLRLGMQRTLSREVYAEYNFILASKDLIPDGIYVIAYSPASVISSIHKYGVSPYAFFAPSALPKKIILFKDYWWYLRQEESERFYGMLQKEYVTEFIIPFPISSSVTMPYSFEMLIRKR